MIIASSFAALLALPLLIAAAPAMTIEVAGPHHGRRAAGDGRSRYDHAASGRRWKRRGPYRRSRAFCRCRIAQWTRGAMARGCDRVSDSRGVAALWRLSMIRRTGLPVAWHRAELARLADARGVSLPVELLEHEAVPGPMTFGISRPVIVLPLDAREWSEAELRCALMHEIEHIQRGDWLMQIVARTVAALYWFHPLVWTAWRRLVPRGGAIL